MINKNIKRISFVKNVFEKCISRHGLKGQALLFVLRPKYISSRINGCIGIYISRSLGENCLIAILEAKIRRNAEALNYPARVRVFNVESKVMDPEKDLLADDLGVHDLYWINNYKPLYDPITS